MLSVRLSLFRRIITPVVSGTVIMLIASTILPVALNRVDEVPETAPAAAGPVVALVTLVALVLLSLRVSGSWRIWSPLIAIAVGCVVAVPFGVYDVQPVRDAGWVGLPEAGFPGLDLTPGVEFWSLLPAFVVVAMVGGIKNIGDYILVQQVSWRRPRATDFRLVQGSLNINGLGILLSGLARDGGIVAAGHSKHHALEAEYGGLGLVDERRHGDTVCSIYQATGRPAAQQVTQQEGGEAW